MVTWIRLQRLSFLLTIAIGGDGLGGETAIYVCFSVPGDIHEPHDSFRVIVVVGWLKTTLFGNQYVLGILTTDHLL